MNSSCQGPMWTVTARSWMPADLQAAMTLATCWNGTLASPRMATAVSGIGLVRPAAAPTVSSRQRQSSPSNCSTPVCIDRDGSEGIVAAGRCDRGDGRQTDVDVTHIFGELRSDKQKDDQQKDDVDHRRQVHFQRFCLPRSHQTLPLGGTRRLGRFPRWTFAKAIAGHVIDQLLRVLVHVGHQSFHATGEIEVRHDRRESRQSVPAAVVSSA